MAARGRTFRYTCTSTSPTVRCRILLLLQLLASSGSLSSPQATILRLISVRQGMFARAGRLACLADFLVAAVAADAVLAACFAWSSRLTTSTVRGYHSCTKLLIALSVQGRWCVSVCSVRAWGLPFWVRDGVDGGTTTLLIMLRREGARDEGAEEKVGAAAMMLRLNRCPCLCRIVANISAMWCIWFSYVTCFGSRAK